MAVDQDRLARLLAAMAFDATYAKGTIQDLSRGQRPMTFTGTPGWSRMNSWPCLRQNAAADGSTSGAVAAIVDVTGAFSVEWCGVPMIDEAGLDILLSQVDANGGFVFAWDQVNTSFVLMLYNNAGFVARIIYTPATSAVLQRSTHVIITSSAGGTAGTAAIRGVPVVTVLAGVGIATNIGADSAVVAGGGGVGMMQSLLSRASAVAWGREDQTCLAEQAKLLVGGAW